MALEPKPYAARLAFDIRESVLLAYKDLKIHNIKYSLVSCNFPLFQAYLEQMRIGFI